MAGWAQATNTLLKVSNRPSSRSRAVFMTNGTDGTVVKCPVCGMGIEPATASGQTEHDGQPKSGQGRFD